MSPEQEKWLKDHPEYQGVGLPRPGVKFRDCGTLYADGEFVPLVPMQVIRLMPGCFAVGIKE